MSNRALILGIGGQDGSYIAELLLAKGYEVHGLHRHSSCGNLQRVEHIRDRITLHSGDLLDHRSIANVFDAVGPEEVYNEADQDHVGYSTRTPLYSCDVTAKGVANLLEIARQAIILPRIFQPISATIFGNAPPPQSEETDLDPRSPYACAKAHALHLCHYHRNVHDLDVRCGILFNHDSPRRGPDYLLQRICRGAMAIHRGEQETLELWGDVEAMRHDIGHAEEFAEAAWRIMQLEQPDDFVVGTGYSYSIAMLVQEAFRKLGIPENRLVVRDPKASGGDICSRADTRKLFHATGWTAYKHAPEVVDDIIDHLRRQA